LSRQALAPVLTALLHQAGVPADVARVYWYTDKADGQSPPDQVVRMVLPHPADGGTSMLRALSADLHKLASRRACDHVLVASDDERLLMAIDDAQLHGVAVHLLADEAARQMEQLSKDDPGWARLLAQAIGASCCTRRPCATSHKAEHPLAWPCHQPLRPPQRWTPRWCGHPCKR